MPCLYCIMHGLLMQDAMKETFMGLDPDLMRAEGCMYPASPLHRSAMHVLKSYSSGLV